MCGYGPRLVARFIGWTGSGRRWKPARSRTAPVNNADADVVCRHVLVTVVSWGSAGSWGSVGDRSLSDKINLAILVAAAEIAGACPGRSPR